MRINNRKGIALLVVYGVIFVLTVLCASFFAGTITENGLINRFDYATHSFWLAEAGLRQGLRELNNSVAQWTGWTDDGGAKKLSVSWTGHGDFEVKVYNYNTDDPFISSWGYFPSLAAPNKVVRNLEVLAGCWRSIFSYAAFGVNSVNMGGTVYTDSYDSDLGLYNQNGNIGKNSDVGTNGDITAVGTTYINGDASTGPGGVFSDQDKVYGTITHENQEYFPAPTVPNNLTGLPGGGWVRSTMNLASGDYKFTGVDLTGTKVLTITGPANIYLTGTLSLDLTGQSQIIISSASTGPVNIYVDGDVSAAGQGIVNQTQKPTDFYIYGTGGTNQDIDLTGQGTLYGAIYAPSADVKVAGTGSGGIIYGSVVGSTVTMSGIAAVHYDEALALQRRRVGKFIIQSWKDNQNPFEALP